MKEIERVGREARKVAVMGDEERWWWWWGFGWEKGGLREIRLWAKVGWVKRDWVGLGLFWFLRLE